MKFVDEATIEVIAGNGGNGVASFRREKFVPRGGPDGGDGGRGGSILAIADSNLNTLTDFRYTRIHRARNGENGRGSDQYGAAAADVVLRVPVGTVVYDAETGAQLFDLSHDKQQVTLAAGGRGGLGNIHFKSSINRAPRQCTPGQQGEQRRLRLELKVLADVGLVGWPNAGKSTLISKISNAKPKIADYPFTTLHPHLGVVLTSAGRHFVMADIPGLIEGAAAGAGLGHQFLRHLTRTRVLLHLVDLSSPDPTLDPVPGAVQHTRALMEELRRYDAALSAKPHWLVLNKFDMVHAEAVQNLTTRFCQALGWDAPVYTISALTGAGTQALIWALQDYLDAERKQDVQQGLTDGVNQAQDPRFDNPMAPGRSKDGPQTL